MLLLLAITRQHMHSDRIISQHVNIQYNIIQQYVVYVAATLLFLAYSCIQPRRINHQYNELIIQLIV